MLPLFLLLLDSPSLPPTPDFKNWHAAETRNGRERICSFSLSPNFYGVVIRHTDARDDFEVSIDSPGVHVLPTTLAIPLKIIVNGQILQTDGRRIDRRLFFRISRSIVDKGMTRRGTMHIILAAPYLPDTLIARYRLQGSDYVGSITRFQACARTQDAQADDATRTLALN